jgi:hypothetical protein
VAIESEVAIAVAICTDVHCATAPVALDEVGCDFTNSPPIGMWHDGRRREFAARRPRTGCWQSRYSRGISCSWSSGGPRETSEARGDGDPPRTRPRSGSGVAGGWVVPKHR